MEDTLKLYLEYATRYLNALDHSVQLAFLAGAALGGMLWYFNSFWHQERVMSKNKIRNRHRKVLDIASQKITEVMEREHVAGHLKRDEVDFVYNMLRKGTKLKELGTEPSYGKPWYYGPASFPNAAKVKAAIIKRLRTIDATRQPWFNLTKGSTKKEGAARQVKTDLLSSLTKKA